MKYPTRVYYTQADRALKLFEPNELMNGTSLNPGEAQPGIGVSYLP